MPQLPADLAATAQAAGVQVTKILHSTEKTMLATGTLDDRQVAIKCLLDPSEFWAAKWRHELRVYQTFAAAPPPITVPKLLYTDDNRLLVLDWIDGRRLDDDRYPQHSLSETDIDRLLNCVTALNQWTAPAGHFEVIFDYPDRFRRYRDKGYLADDDYDALLRLLADAGDPDQLNHGDPVPSNILITEQGAALLDWEFTGLFLPGFDLAMIHTQPGAHTPQTKARIDAMVAASGHQTPFAINLAAVLTRELRLHRELPEGPLRDQRLPMIETAWTQARERIHELAGRR